MKNKFKNASREWIAGLIVAVKSAALMLGMLLGAGEAYGQMIPPPPPNLQSLELTLMNADAVVTGVVVKPQFPFPPPLYNNGESWTATIVVKETLKGVPRDSIQFQTKAYGGEWGSSTLVLVAIPVGSRSNPTVINLADKQLAVMTADLRLLKTPDEVTTAAKEILRREANAKPPAKFGVPVEAAKVAGTPLDIRSIFWGPKNFVFLDVPIDQRLEVLARQEIRAADPFVRINGAAALLYFKSTENIELLRPLLNDPAWSNENIALLDRRLNDPGCETEKNLHLDADQNSTILRAQYKASEAVYDRNNNKILRAQYNCVRRQAFATLRALGADVEEPISFRPVSIALVVGRVTEADIQELLRYPNLEDLDLANQNLTEAQWATIGQLRNLKTLFLESSNISDLGLKGLSGLPNLLYLGLGNTGVTDAGLMELANFKSLRKVDLGQRVTADGVAALARVRPDINVRLDEFAFLEPLHPRRIEQPLTETRRSSLPVENVPPAAGLRYYVLIFPKETASQVVAWLLRELPHHGWESTDYGYRRNGDFVETSDYYTTEEKASVPDMKSGELLIVVGWNIDLR